MKDKEYFLKELHRRGYDNPKLSELSEKALMRILKNEESFYKRNSTKQVISSLDNIAKEVS